MQNIRTVCELAATLALYSVLSSGSAGILQCCAPVYHGGAAVVPSRRSDLPWRGAGSRAALASPVLRGG
jgi:hypothetical protein